MGGRENLKPFGTLTEAEHRRIAKNGGKASGAARRRTKTLREAMAIALSLPAKGQPDKSNLEAIVAKALSQALRGDDRARQFVFQILGGLKGELQAPVVKQILRRYLGKQLTITEAALQVEMAGAPLPESLKIQLSKMESEPEDPTDGVFCTISNEEMEKRVAERRLEAEKQLADLPRRREEMAMLHKLVADPFAPGATPHDGAENE